MSLFIVYSTNYFTNIHTIVAIVSSEDAALKAIEETEKWEEKKGLDISSLKYKEIIPNVNYITESEDGPAVL